MNGLRPKAARGLCCRLRKLSHDNILSAGPVIAHLGITGSSTVRSMAAIWDRLLI